jgi:hypothetical protein
VLRTIDASPVGAALAAYLADVPGGFIGTLSELLDRLERYRPLGEAWPRSAKGLGDALRRLAPALRLIGFECKALPKTGGVIRWHIFSTSELCEPRPASPASLGPGVTTTPKPAGLSAAAGHAGHSRHGVGSQAMEKGVSVPYGADAADEGEVF